MGVGYISKLDIFKQLYDDKLITDQAWLCIKALRHVAKKALAALDQPDHVISQLHNIETFGIQRQQQQHSFALEERQWRDLMSIFKHFETFGMLDTKLLWLAIDPTLIQKDDTYLEYLVAVNKLSSKIQKQLLEQVMNVITHGVEVVCYKTLKKYKS